MFSSETGANSRRSSKGFADVKGHDNYHGRNQRLCVAQIIVAVQQVLHEHFEHVQAPSASRYVGPVAHSLHVAQEVKYGVENATGRRAELEKATQDGFVARTSTLYCLALQNDCAGISFPFILLSPSYRRDLFCVWPCKMFALALLFLFFVSVQVLGGTLYCLALKDVCASFSFSFFFSAPCKMLALFFFPRPRS